MSEDYRLIGRIKDEVIRFGEYLGEGLDKPTKKFLIQMLYGIQASRDVKLSNISRALKERIRLIKTETRLSRNLRRAGLDEVIRERVLEAGKDKIRHDTVLAVDISDISKESARKMEHIDIVRDGSADGELRRGYWLLGIYGADVHRSQVVPLFLELYSQKGDDFRSENQKMLEAIERVSEKLGGKGIFAIDRGGDRRALFIGLLRREG